MNINTPICVFDIYQYHSKGMTCNIGQSETEINFNSDSATGISDKIDINCVRLSWKI